MSIANKLVTMAENVNKVYEAGKEAAGGEFYDKGYGEGYEAGYNKAESENPLYYAYIKAFQWYKVAFPEGFDFVLKLRKKPDDMNALLSGATGLKTVTLICEAEGTVAYSQMVRETTATVLDISGFKPKPKDMSYFAYDAELVTIIGALDLSQCTNVTNAFAADFLENIEFVPNTIPISISFSYSTKLTHDSLMSIINGLATVTETKTLTLGTTNLAKLTTEEKAIATQKNWSLA